MKLLSLNIQSGAQSPRFLKYINQQKNRIDIFCFQEVFDSKASLRVGQGENTDIFARLKKELKNFVPYFYPVSNTLDEYFKLKHKMVLGLVIFVKKGIPTGKHFGRHVIGSVDSPVNFEIGKESNAVQCLEIFSKEGNFWLMNFHGQSLPGNKLDTPERIKQSNTLVKVAKQLKQPLILCGDFNLMPKTQSIGIIEKAGLKNLIKKYKIKNTRNSISWKRYNNHQHFADFTFVSQQIKVKNFKVPYTLASDHLPMIMEFRIERLKD